MNFGVGLILFILGSIAVAVCLFAIPGAGGAAPPPADHSHGHGGH